MRHLAQALLYSASLLPALLPLLAHPAHAAPLAAHHAVYTLTLDASKTDDVIAAHGTMTYDVTDACTSWTTSQHLVIDLTNKDGNDVHMISDYATQESKDGTHLEFHTRQVTNQATTEKLDGTATLEHAGGRGHADFINPEKTTVLLPEGTLLPMAHTNALLNAAAAGKKFLSVPLFDGTGADGAQDTFVTLESWNKPSPQKWAALSPLSSGHVHIAFFDRSSATETPNYEIGMTYFANGVADSLAMNFGDFLMNGRLDQLDVRASPKC
jgi:hypothetical protein